MLAPGLVMNKRRIPLFARAARSASPAGAPGDPDRPLSILLLSAASYGVRPGDDVTVPTGFDPVTVALFETIVEGAYLVANADGLFDDEERNVFERIVVDACGGTVSSQQIAALVCDLRNQLREDGIDRRIQNLATSVSKKEHAHEVLRIAALIAQVSDGVSEVERDVLAKIATSVGLEAGEVAGALADAQGALVAAGVG
jgi:tellurite resistance protein